MLGKFNRGHYDLDNLPRELDDYFHGYKYFAGKLKHKNQLMRDKISKREMKKEIELIEL